MRHLRSHGAVVSLNSPVSTAGPALAIALSKWTVASHAKNGTPIRIRPLRADDREREIAFINSLSEESRYFRMFTPQKYLPPHLVDQLMDIDGDRRMAFVATVGVDTQERFIGISRYGGAEEPHTAELGITVADDWLRQGIATQLIEQLCRYAKSRGIARLVGLVLAQNTRMLALAHRMGFSSRHVDGGLIRIELDLDVKSNT